MSESIITKNILFLFYVLHLLVICHLITYQKKLIWHLIHIVSFKILHHLLIWCVSEMKSFHLFFALFGWCPFWPIRSSSNAFSSFPNNGIEDKVLDSRFVGCARNLPLRKWCPFCFRWALLKSSQITRILHSASSVNDIINIEITLFLFSGWRWGGVLLRLY